MGKTTRKARLRDDTARIIAEIHGVSTSYVQKVRNGERDNDEIMATLVDFEQGKSNLIRYLENLVPSTRKVAGIHGVSTSYVQKVRKGEMMNEAIMETLVDLAQGKSRLIRYVADLIPITSNPEKYAGKKN